MPRLGVVPSISRRSRHQPTLDIRASLLSTAEVLAESKRVQARLAQRAIVKASAESDADVVKRVRAQLTQRPAVRASAVNVAAKRQEVPRVPRVARQPRQHATTLKSNESSPKAIRHVVPARTDKSRAVQNVQPRNVPAGRCLAPRPTDYLVVAPMAPRATRFRAVDVSPLAFSLPRTPKVALKSILRGSASQQKRREQKKVSFGDVETKEVEKWIGIEQGTECHGQLFDDGTTKCQGQFIHIYPDPCRVLGSKIVGWYPHGTDDEDFTHMLLFGQDPISHRQCTNSGCNRVRHYRRRQ